MVQVSTNPELIHFYRTLNEVADFYTFMHAELMAGYVFQEACTAMQINSAEDVPDVVVENGTNVRKQFLQVRWYYVRGHVEELTDFEKSEAVRLDVQDIVEAIGENSEVKFQ